MFFLKTQLKSFFLINTNQLSNIIDLLFQKKNIMFPHRFSKENIYTIILSFVVKNSFKHQKLKSWSKNNASVLILRKITKQSVKINTQHY
jgi:hypothetical protein